MNLLRQTSAIPLRRWDPRAHTIQPSSGIRLKKSSGQYIITNEDLLDRIVAAAGIRPSDTVLELGAGSGSITSRILPIARHVHFSESDSSMAHETLRRAQSEGFTNISHLLGDATTANLPRFDVCISNLPFSLSAPILFRLIQHRPLWRSAVLILQREFVDALIADPGERNYSRLSLNASVFVRTERVHRINGGCFYPVPPVESAIARLTPRNPPPQFDFSEFNELTKIAFIEKKRAIKAAFNRPSVQRMLENNYKTYCSFHRIPTSPIAFPAYLRSVLESTGLQDCPARYMPPEGMEHVLAKLHEAGIYFTSIASNRNVCPASKQIQSIPAEQVVDVDVQEETGDFIPVVS